MMMLKKFRCLVLTMTLILVIVSCTTFAANKPIKFKVAFTDSPILKIGDASVFHPAYALMLAFQSAMEQYSQGRVDVELYTNGRLGDGKSCLEQVLAGNIGATTPGDGQIAPFYKNLQVLMAPYVIEDALQLYKVLDGPFGQKLFNDMAAKSGIRVLSCIDNGGFRNISNSKKKIKVPADMKGLKIRAPESQIYVEIVKSTGAAATPIAFAELYSALQTGVVDGQDNSALVMLGGSLQEVQKYYTLTHHLLSTAYLVASEKYLKSLPPSLQLAFKKAGMEAALAGRGSARAYESLALSQLKKSGVKVYIPTTAEKKLWQKTQASSLTWLRKNTDPKLVDEFISAAKKALITK
jgi:tripartite ATP-independent transporter DctP family solute receptor